MGHGLKARGHRRHSSSQDIPQLRTFPGSSVSPLAEPGSALHLEPRRQPAACGLGSPGRRGLAVLLHMPGILLESHKLSTKHISGKS